MTPTKTPREIILESLYSYFVITDTNGKGVDGFMEDIDTLLEEARQDAREEVIDYISQNQGWEDSEDMYREHFGLSPKYK